MMFRHGPPTRPPERRFHPTAARGVAEQPFPPQWSRHDGRLPPGSQRMCRGAQARSQSDATPCHGLEDPCVSGAGGESDPKGLCPLEPRHFYVETGTASPWAWSTAVAASNSTRANGDATPNSVGIKPPTPNCASRCCGKVGDRRLRCKKNTLLLVQLSQNNLLRHESNITIIDRTL